MFNECHIHLCDCTWLNVFSHAEFLLIKHKMIFVCFSCFWKVFCFYKNCQNLKNSVALSWWLSHGLVQSWKYLEHFLKIWVLIFLTAQYGDLFAGGRSSHERYTDFRDSLTGRLSSREKHLENISNFCFKVFWRLALATWFSRENHVFYVLRAVFKTFQFSLEHFWLFIVFPFYPSPKLTVSLSKNLHFCNISSSNLQGKGMGFLFLTSYFMIMVLFSWFVSYFFFFVIWVI